MADVGGINVPNVDLASLGGPAILILVLVILLSFIGLLMFITIFVMMHNTKVTVVRKEGMGVKVLDFKGMKVIKANTMTKFYLFRLWPFFRREIAPVGTEHFYDGRVFLEQYGDTDYRPIDIQANSPLGFYPVQQIDKEFIAASIIRTAERTAKKNELLQMAMFALPIVFAILSLVLAIFVWQGFDKTSQQAADVANSVSQSSSDSAKILERVGDKLIDLHNSLGGTQTIRQDEVPPLGGGNG